jgi:hypothetical protein
MTELSQGIAIAGIWLAVGMTGWKYGGIAIGVAFFAMFATLAVVGI